MNILSPIFKDISPCFYRGSWYFGIVWLSKRTPFFKDFLCMITIKHSEPQLDFSDVLLVPRVHTKSIASRSEVSLLDPNLNAVPIIVANMDSIGTFQMARHLKEFRLMVALLKDFPVSEWEENVKELNLDPALLIPSLGTRDLDKEIARLKTLTSLFPTIPFVCLDVANGYLQASADAVRALKDALPDVKVCAGNVVDELGVEHLARAGADIVKIGIGSGGVCLTRQKTGVGYPQFSAMHRVRAAATALNVQLVSDGGITNPGDVAKAFAAGSDFVMAGSYFAGHEETGTHFHGMSSDRSRVKRGEAVLDYRATEGREVVLHSKGSLAHTLRDLTGGLRSACTYLGVSSLDELKHAEIEVIRVNQQLNRISGVASEGK